MKTALLILTLISSYSLAEEKKSEARDSRRQPANYSAVPVPGMSVSEGNTTNGTIYGKFQDGKVVCYYVTNSNGSGGVAIHCSKINE